MKLGLWRSAFRLARRSVGRTPGRALLIAALVGLPVFGAVSLDLVLRTAEPPPEAYARWYFGAADAHLEVTSFEHTSLDFLSRTGVELSPTQVRRPDDPGRDPAAVDVAKLLPAGTGIYPASANRPRSVPLAAHDRLVRADVDLIDTRNAMSDGMTRLRSGRLPKALDEIAVTPSVAERLGLDLRSDATLRLPNQRTVRVVGLAERPDCLGCDGAIGLPGGRLEVVGVAEPAKLAWSSESSAYFLNLPDLSRPELSALVEKLGAQGIGLLPRDVVLHPDAWSGLGSGVPPPASRTYLTERAGAFTLAVVLIGFGLLEVVLLAGTAFAVGVRRQVREFGLLVTTGATPRDVRRMVLAQGILLGLLGSVGGIVLGLAVPRLAGPVLEPIFHRELATWAFAPLDYVLLALLGALAGLIAAVVPAYGAGRLDPVLALAGRFGVPLRRARIARTAACLLCSGVVAGCVGTGWLDRQFREFQHDAGALRPAGPLALILGGLVLVTAGLIWLMPAALTLVAALGRALPATARLGFRDASRHRRRTAPAATAIMIAVAASIGLAYVLVGQTASDRAHYDPAAAPGQVVVEAEHPDRSRRSTPPELLASARAARQELGGGPLLSVGEVLAPPGKVPDEVTDGDSATEPAQVSAYAPGSPVESARSVGTVDPDLIATLPDSGSAAAAAALRAGRMVVLETPTTQPGGTPGWPAPNGALIYGSDSGARPFTTLPVHELRVARYYTKLPYAIVAPATAERLGLPVRLSHLVLDPAGAPSQAAEDRAAAAAAGEGGRVTVERGFQPEPPTYLIGAIGVTLIVTLAGVAIAVALSNAEGRPDLATLAAVGAQPWRRRGIVAAQAFLIGTLGCVLGIALGSFLGFATRVSTLSPSFVVPWPNLAATALIVPLLAAVCAALFTGSKLPMIRRTE